MTIISGSGSIRKPRIITASLNPQKDGRATFEITMPSEIITTLGWNDKTIVQLGLERGELYLIKSETGIGYKMRSKGHFKQVFMQNVNIKIFKKNMLIGIVIDNMIYLKNECDK